MASGTPSVKWTREQTLVAINLYCKLPFGKLHKTNPVIVSVAKKMGRTPSSLGMKLCNFASLDPVQKARGIAGLAGASRQDQEIWNEFHADVKTLGPESEQLLDDLFELNAEQELDVQQHDQIQIQNSRHVGKPTGSTEKVATVRVRRGQQFFRQAILCAYGGRCCISGINVPQFLVASHIKPWSDFPDERLDPRNGLCLSSLHDAAFDSGLITLDEKLSVVLSKRLRSYFPQPTLEQTFQQFEGHRIRLPDKLAEPAGEFLEYHRKSVFHD
jgi:hypothetical protein